MNTEEKFRAVDYPLVCKVYTSDTLTPSGFATKPYIVGSLPSAHSIGYIFFSRILNISIQLRENNIISAGSGSNVRVHYYWKVDNITMKALAGEALEKKKLSFKEFKKLIR